MEPKTVPRAVTLLQKMARGAVLKHGNSAPLPALRQSFRQRSSHNISVKGASRKAASSNQVLQDSSSPTNPSYPAFSFRGLGASPRLKYFLIACLTVLGTMESVFWFKILWAKFSPAPESSDKSAD